MKILKVNRFENLVVSTSGHRVSMMMIICGRSYGVGRNREWMVVEDGVHNEWSISRNIGDRPD